MQHSIRATARADTVHVADGAVPPGDGEATIPQWAANLQASVARIEGQVGQIPDIIKELKEVSAKAVTRDDHIRLLAEVEILKERDLGQRSDWEDMKTKVLDPKGQLQTMWEERSQIKGSIATWRFLAVASGLVFGVITLFATLHSLGVSIRIGG
jgi:hypothetical protein